MRKVILIVAFGALLAPAQDRRTVQLLVGGDVNWSLEMSVPSIYSDKGTPAAKGWGTPYLATPQSLALLEKQLGKPLETGAHDENAIQYGLKFSSKLEEVRYPFLKIRPFIQEHDVVFVNLENPLSDTARRVGTFRAPSLLADALRWAGITVVSIANNHMLDAEGQGLMDTIASLSRAGVGHAGAGRNLEDARRPWIVEKHGIRIAFLSYTQHANLGERSFAQADHSGVMPMDPFLMEEDIRRVRDRADYVAVSIHWGSTNRVVHPANRKMAHRLVDAGADLVLGDHSPLAKGVEVYKGRLILYAQGHLIFGHNHEEWSSGYLIRATLAPRKIEGVEILPISGKGHDMGQPYLLKGAEAREVLAEVQTRSAALDTPVRIDGDRGIVSASFERR